MVLQLQLQHISILVIDLHLITDCLLADSLEMNWHDYTAAEIAIQLVILHVSLNYLHYSTQLILNTTVYYLVNPDFTKYRMLHRICIFCLFYELHSLSYLHND